MSLNILGTHSKFSLLSVFHTLLPLSYSLQLCFPRVSLMFTSVHASSGYSFSQSVSFSVCFLTSFLKTLFLENKIKSLFWVHSQKSCPTVRLRLLEPSLIQNLVPQLGSGEEFKHKTVGSIVRHIDFLLIVEKQKSNI